ncbi:YuzB family protein [Paenibacillus woosongensis]|uniref:YuzB family protein n=1 Tax=Paenibacillus woosongensis TaxID=307580 RepID=A0AA95KT08_9BACL|nr:YuzB family protein [Paenibacillus woosongensis]WHX48323.1 YuzB family protein [Paenibacillus woosongensis]
MPRLKIILEFCANNAHFGTDEIMKRLEQHPDCEVYEYGCLTGCGMCYMTPYALVNGETVEAETASALYDAIIRRIADVKSDNG